ncbi:MAG: enoyl-CoA hydratase-related protein, partial [Gammaproteobacteria bacterium]|nr:enoyl-CoA hydratase-related protein [Gammaproteobacteria bacterium]
MYTLEGEVAVIGMDDGKANAVGHALIDEINQGLTRSLAEAKAVVIVGRPGMFSAGFDLKEFENGPEATTALVAKGARMMLRLFSHPQPVVAACTGHAIAAGAFMLLASDTRIGVQGEFKIGLNET